MTAPKPKRRDVIQLVDRQWCRVNMKDHREVCCDCGLAHDVQFRKAGRHIEFRATRNGRATAAARKAKRPCRG
jgi:hypothetical protein